MLDNKRGQLGETMTWIVATLIIVVILSITVSFAFSLGSDKQIKIEDKEKDFLATKSITSFLGNGENVELLNNGNYEAFKESTGELVKNFPKPVKGGAGSWNFEIDGVDLSSNYKLLLNFGQYDYFETDILFNKIKLKYWLECQGKCV
tara:strand:+ start:444 stop:887 length:444 start_codon:yes stop_codon:yes gene_type:complete